MLTLLFVCLCHGTLGQPMLTYYDETAMTWADAQVFCRNHHTDLPTVLDLSESAFIIQESWLGLYRTSARAPWKWSAGDVPLSYNATWQSEPGIDEHCVYKLASSWRSESCSEKHTFYCVDEPAFLVQERKTWEEALEHCRSIQKKNISISYELAILPTVEEQTKAQTLIQAVNKNQVWVGLRFMGDQWMWITGQEEHGETMQTSPSAKRCGTLRVNMTAESPLNTKKCHKTMFFICSIVPPKVSLPLVGGK